MTTKTPEKPDDDNNRETGVGDDMRDWLSALRRGLRKKKPPEGWDGEPEPEREKGPPAETPDEP